MAKKQDIYSAAVLDAASGAVLQQVRSADVRSALFAPNGEWLVVSLKKVQRYDNNSFVALGEAALPEGVDQLRFLSATRVLAWSEYNTSIRVLAFPSFAEELALDEKVYMGSRISFSEDGGLHVSTPVAKRMALSWEGKQIVYFSDTSATIVDPLRPADSRTIKLPYSSGGGDVIAVDRALARLVALERTHGSVAIYDLNKKQLMEQRRFDKPMRDVALSPDGRWVAVLGQDGATRVWQPGSPEKGVTLVNDRHDWVVFSDAGYFDASNRGGRLVAMVAGTNGYNIDQFAARFNRPDLLLTQMGSSNRQLVAHYQQRDAARGLASYQAYVPATTSSK